MSKKYEFKYFPKICISNILSDVSCSLKKTCDISYLSNNDKHATAHSNKLKSLILIDPVRNE